MSTAKILVVDDEPSVRYFIVEALSYNGHEIIAIEDGQTALDLVQTETFDVAVLDLKMGDVGGLEVLKALHKTAPDTSAIVLTGHGSMETVIEAMDQGAHAYLLKPCDPQKLRSRVAEGLQKHREKVRQKRKGKFISDISHELRNPITTIELYLELMEHSEPEKKADCVEGIRQATTHMGQLVENSRTLARLDQDAVELNFKPVDLNVLIQQIIELYQPRVEKAGLRLEHDIASEIPAIQGVRSQIVQVITNLLNNAINYTFRGHIYIRTLPDQEKKQICLQIQDTGIGIPPEDMPHLFERFRRGKHARKYDIPGNGLGLTIVKEIIDLHNGKIEVESEVNVGSTFSIWLPIAE